MKCDYCDQRATTLAGDTNGVLVCEDHVRLFAERSERHHPKCYQGTGVPVDPPAGLCDCSALQALDAAAVICPWCKATGADPCRTTDGHRRVPHKARARMERAARREAGK